MRLCQCLARWPNLCRSSPETLNQWNADLLDCSFVWGWFVGIWQEMPLQAADEDVGAYLRRGPRTEKDNEGQG